MNKITSKCKTVDSAIQKALSELKVGRGEVNVNVIFQGSQGFLGFIGRKDAIVEVTIKDEKSFYCDSLNQILKTMDFSVDVNAQTLNDTLHLNIESTDDLGGLLIGKNGRTFDALENLLKRIRENRGFRKDKVSLDVENYRKRQEQRPRGRMGRSDSRPKRVR